jgi:hypothetical protein
MSAGGEMLRVGAGGEGRGGVGPPGVTVRVKEACGVEFPLESWARQETVCVPTRNSPPEGRLQTRL